MCTFVSQLVANRDAALVVRVTRYYSITQYYRVV